MSNEFPELDRTRVTVDETTRERHLSAIQTAIRAQRTPRIRRLRLLAVALALLLALPVMALAAENSVPGDLLYPVKRAAEPLVQIFDRDVAAEHRVEEVEILFARDAPSDVIHDHANVARDAVTDRQPHLTDRIDRIVDDLDRRHSDHSSDAATDNDYLRSSDPDQSPDRATSTTHGTTDEAPRSDRP